MNVQVETGFIRFRVTAVREGVEMDLTAVAKAIALSAQTGGKTDAQLTIELPGYEGLDLRLESAGEEEEVVLSHRERVGRAPRSVEGRHGVASPSTLIVEGTKDSLQILDRGLCWVHPNQGAHGGPVLSMRMGFGRRAEEGEAPEVKVEEVAMVIQNARLRAVEVIEGLLG